MKFLNRLREYVSALVALFLPYHSEQQLSWKQFALTILAIILIIAILTYLQLRYWYDYIG